MKTIDLITQTADLMKKIGIPAEMTIGSFKLTGYGHLANWAGRQGQLNYMSVQFTIRIKPSHIQGLKLMNVKLDLDKAIMADLSPSAKRFKSGMSAIKQGDYAPFYYMGDPANHQTGAVDNWLDIPAECDVQTLSELDKFCRDNYRDVLAFNNYTALKNAGWKFKNHYSMQVEIETQYKNIKAIRRTTQGVAENKLLPIQKRVLNLN